jgi:mRNA interferase MazF
MPFNCGDVVLVLFPNSNLRTAKRRPALIVMADGLNTGLPQTIIAMITSNTTRAPHPSRCHISKSSPEALAMGLLTDSVIMADNLATVLHSEIDRVIGHCPALSQVQAALRHTFSL